MAPKSMVNLSPINKSILYTTKSNKYNRKRLDY